MKAELPRGSEASDALNSMAAPPCVSENVPQKFETRTKIVNENGADIEVPEAFCNGERINLP